MSESLRAFSFLVDQYSVVLCFHPNEKDDHGLKFGIG